MKKKRLRSDYNSHFDNEDFNPDTETVYWSLGNVRNSMFGKLRLFNLFSEKKSEENLGRQKGKVPFSFAVRTVIIVICAIAAFGFTMLFKSGFFANYFNF